MAKKPVTLDFWKVMLLVIFSGMFLIFTIGAIVASIMGKKFC